MLRHRRVINQLQEVLVGFCSEKLLQGIDRGHSDSRGQSRVHSYCQNLLARPSPAQDFLLGMKPGLGAGGAQQVGQIDWIALLQIRKRLVFPTFRNDPGDVSSRPSFETRFAPASEEKPSRTITVHVGNSSALDEIFLFLGEARAVGSDPVNE